MSEDSILAKFHQHLWNNHPNLRNCCWHIANERKTSLIQGAILKAKGVLAGAPDYVINYAGKTYYIEFKTDGGRISSEQKKVHEALLKQGFNVLIFWNLEAALNWFNNMFSNI